MLMDDMATAGFYVICVLSPFLFILLFLFLVCIYDIFKYDR